MVWEEGGERDGEGDAGRGGRRKVSSTRASVSSRAPKLRTKNLRLTLDHFFSTQELLDVETSL